MEYLKISEVAKLAAFKMSNQEIADAISMALNIEALNVSAPLSEETDILFLGCSYYAFDVDPIVKDLNTEKQPKTSENSLFSAVF